MNDLLVVLAWLMLAVLSAYVWWRFARWLWGVRVRLMRRLAERWGVEDEIP